jgi:hypothetical protein
MVSFLQVPCGANAGQYPHLHKAHAKLTMPRMEILRKILRVARSLLFYEVPIMKGISHMSMMILMLRTLAFNQIYCNLWNLVALIKSSMNFLCLIMFQWRHSIHILSLTRYLFSYTSIPHIKLFWRACRCGGSGPCQQPVCDCFTH